MTKLQFIAELREVLEIDEELTEESDLTTFEEYSSLSILSLIVFIDEKFGKRMPADQLMAAPKVQQLIALIGADAFE